MEGNRTGGETGRQVGLLVDAVEDILAVSEDMLQTTPDIGSEAAAPSSPAS